MRIFQSYDTVFQQIYCIFADAKLVRVFNDIPEFKRRSFTKLMEISEFKNVHFTSAVINYRSINTPL